MKFKEIIWKILAGIGTFAAAVFYVLFEQKKVEDLEDQKAAAEAVNKYHEKLQEENKENEELKNKAMAGNTDAAANSVDELLRNTAKKSKSN